MPASSPFIHVVDDDPSVCLGLKRLLNAWGMRVRTFGSGAEFLEALSSSCDADCSVIDVQMPGMTGLEVHDRMRRAGIDVPVIFITAHEEEGAEEKALGAGALGYLRKPFLDEVLVNLIRKAAQRQQSPHPNQSVPEHF